MQESTGRPDAPEPMSANYGDRHIGLTAANNAMPPKPQNNIRDIQITQLDHGYVVVVGCQRFAIENSSTLLAKLAEYVLQPAATEQNWSKGRLF
jgi:hypothetical protein